MVTDEMQRILVAPFTSHELLDALCGLARDSCPGEDGLLPAFFIYHWDTLGEGLQLAFQEIMERGTMLETLLEGLIFLIPKEGGNLDELRHW